MGRTSLHLATAQSVEPLLVAGAGSRHRSALAGVFTPVPEPKRVKNRVHWDVWGSRDSLLAAGASLLRARDDEIGWDILADPAGNEFCVFVPGV